MGVRRSSFWWPLAIFLGLALGIGLAGYTYHQREEAALIGETQKALASITELKIAQIRGWREEQLRDALLATRDRTLIRAVRAFLGTPDAEREREAIIDWLDTLKQVYHYRNLMVLDREGRPRLASTGDNLALERSLEPQILEARRTQQPVLTDLHGGESHGTAVHMEVIAPLLSEVQPPAAIGFLLITLDPSQFLFPLVQSWPVPSATAESLLVRQEGNEVVFLNLLRHRDVPPLFLRVPLEAPHLPAARVVRGESGAILGIDYRGVPVIAFVKSIRGTPWHFVAKVDEEEALAPALAQRLLLAGFIGVMLLASALLAGLLFSRQQAGAYRQLYQAQGERLRAEAALRRSEERLRLAQDAANAGTWEWDLRTNENFWSEEVWRLYGLEPYSREASYDTWLRTIHPDDRGKTEEAVQRAALDGLELSAEWRVWAPDGPERWLMSRGRPVRDADGRPIRYLGIVMDITTRRQTETALRQWADAFTFCAHGIAIGIPSTQTLLTCNPAFAAMHRRTVDEIAGLPILDLYEPSEHDRVRRWLAEADETGQVQYETLMRRRDGSTFPVQMDVVSVRDEDGGLRYRVATAQDIRRRKEAVDALRVSLEDKVALLKEVHHRVKNNLQIVASLVNLQAGRSQNPDVIDVLRETGNRVRSMALLHEVLYASGTLASIDFSRYVEDLCRQLLRTYGQATGRIRVENRVDRIGLPLETSVPCGLIINELVSNSFKHAFPDGRAGTVTVELQLREEGRLTLCVRDDGVGLGRGFDPAATATLGLQLVSNLAGQLGGRLTVTGGPGGGTTFSVAFSVPEAVLTSGRL